MTRYSSALRFVLFVTPYSLSDLRFVLSDAPYPLVLRISEHVLPEEIAVLARQSYTEAAIMKTREDLVGSTQN